MANLDGLAKSLSTSFQSLLNTTECLYEYLCTMYSILCSCKKGNSIPRLRSIEALYDAAGYILQNTSEYVIPVIEYDIEALQKLEQEHNAPPPHTDADCPPGPYEDLYCPYGDMSP